MRTRLLVLATLVATLLTAPTFRPALAQTEWLVADSLDLGLPGSLVPSLPELGVDAGRNVLAVWAYSFAVPGEIHWSRCVPGSGWSGKTVVDLGSYSDRVYGIRLATNAAGKAWLALNGHAGVYALAYDPVTGWGPPVTIRSGPNAFLDFANALRVTIDDTGIGTLLWGNPNQDTIFFARSDAGGAWSAPQPIMNSTSWLGGLSFAANRHGQGALAWERYTPTGPWTIFASRYDPTSGWESPTPLVTTATYHFPQVAVNDSGSFVVAWVDYDSHFPLFDVVQRRYTAGQGWTAIEYPGQGRFVTVALAHNGDECLMWESLGDSRVVARRWLSDAGWLDEETVQTFPLGGDPTIFGSRLDRAGNGLAYWGTPHVPSSVETARLLRTGGWQPIHVFEAGADILAGATLAFTDDGAAIGLMHSYVVFDGQFINSFDDVLVSRTASTSVPVQLSLVDATVDADGVRLRWFSAADPVREAAVQRREARTAWLEIARVSADGTGMITYRDRAVAEGTHYGYRLAVLESGVTHFLGETWVDVPRSGFALGRVRPNPVVAGRFTIGLDLARPAPARLELLDVSGRLRVARTLAGLEPGHHEVTLGTGGELEQGLYFLRLTQGERSAVRRLAIAR